MAIKPFAKIENGKVVNRSRAEEGTYDNDPSFVEIPDGVLVEIGCDYDATNGFTDILTHQFTPEQLLETMRHERNLLLSKTDWTQQGDVPEATKTKWQSYRQTLRDLPANQTPDDIRMQNITWPTKPT
tara:strand:- start:258 stop:641 length:384 start_codon:yes stop_codon:yes gene_type:complete